jgi:Ca2+-binding RTX toxin-like protein
MATDRLLLGADVGRNQIWLQRSGDDLLVSIIGTTDSSRLLGWYSVNTTSRLDRLVAGDGSVMTEARVEDLVQAMAAVTPPPIGQVNLTAQQQAILSSAIATAWQDGGIGESLMGDALPNWLQAGGRDDTLDGGMGADTLIGGNGSDLVSYATATGAVTVNLAGGVALGAAGNDSLSGIENVLGGTGADCLLGDAGANQLSGGAGADVLFGQAGNDCLDGGNGADNLFGGEGNDWLVAGEGNDCLNGEGGNDTLIAGNGDDVIYNDAGVDSVLGGAGNDTVYLDGLINETILGGEGSDQLFVQALSNLGNARIEGFETLLITTPTSYYDYALRRMVDYSWQNIFLTSAQFASFGVIRSGNGERYKITGVDAGLYDLSARTVSWLAELNGSSWADTLRGDSDGNRMNGGYGDDVIEGGLGSDGLNGGAGNDTILGGEDGDVLNGGDGADSLDGGNGADNLIGGVGSDDYRLNRGGGADRLDNASADYLVATDRLLFGADVTRNQLWLQRSGNDLLLSIVGTTDSSRVLGWYNTGTAGTASRLDSFVAGDGRVMTEARVEALVQAMATMTPPPAGQTNLTTEQQTLLSTAIAAAWQ